MEDTIIYFYDNIDSDMLTTAYKHSKESDLMLCLGSSFMVEPACSMVMRGKSNIILCNRQNTKIDA